MLGFELARRRRLTRAPPPGGRARAAARRASIESGGVIESTRPSSPDGEHDHAAAQRLGAGARARSGSSHSIAEHETEPAHLDARRARPAQPRAQVRERGAPISAARSTSFSSSSTASEASAAAQPGGWPRKVCVCSASPCEGGHASITVGAADAGRDRHARGEALADAQQIRHDALVLAGEPAARCDRSRCRPRRRSAASLRASQSARSSREEAARRNALAAAALDRLDEHGADRAPRLARARGARRPRRRSARSASRPGRRAANGSRKSRAPGRVERAEREPVVGALEGDDAGAAGREQRGLERGLDGVRARASRARRAPGRRPGSARRAPRAARP